jgi:hypothetical protein
MKNYTKKYLTPCYIHLTKDMEHVNLCGILWYPIPLYKEKPTNQLVIYKNCYAYLRNNTD